MKTNNILKEDIKKFTDELLKFNNSNDAFIFGLSSPSFEEALITYLDKFGISFDEEEIDITESPIDIDSDGYPFIEAYIEIKRFKLSLNCISYHHDYWDFYIENLVQWKDIYSKKEILKTLYERRNEHNEVELNTMDDLIENYYVGKKYVFVKVEEGTLIIPYYSTFDNSTCITYDVLDADESFLAKDNKEEIQNVINEYREIANFLEDSLK